MITFVWWAIVGLCLCFGFLGCFINKIPGPIAVVLATVLAILLLKLPIGWATVAVIAALAVGSMIGSKVLVVMVKKLQEFSKRASWGTTIGSIVGIGVLAKFANGSSTVVSIMLLILGLVVLPFVFAFLLELTNQQGAPKALKSASAATGAYLADTCLKLIVFVYAIYAIFDLEF